MISNAARRELQVLLAVPTWVLVPLLGLVVGVGLATALGRFGVFHSALGNRHSAIPLVALWNLARLLWEEDYGASSPAASRLCG